MNISAKKHITALVNKSRGRVHGRNLLNQLERAERFEKEKRDRIEQLSVKYSETFGRDILCHKEPSSVSLKTFVETLNDYYHHFEELNIAQYFSAQTKLRPTILEEFLFVIFQKFLSEFEEKIGDNESFLESGTKRSYTNLFFYGENFEDFIREPRIGVNEKDQDFGIFRKFSLNGRDIHLPCLAIEVKTYLDKTMLDSAIASAEKVKRGNPHCLFLVVCETYDVSTQAVPAYSELDQIYVLRKCKRRDRIRSPKSFEIDGNVVFSILGRVEAHLSKPWTDIDASIRNKGEIL